MRKVTQQVCQAFINGNRKVVGNTMTDGQRLYLHGNMIAEKQFGRFILTLAGWNTPTTRERLNGLLELLGWTMRYRSRKGQAMLIGSYFASGDCAVGDRETLELRDRSGNHATMANT